MKIIVSIASTTHIDRHNERISKSVLDDMAKQTKDKYIPLLFNHEWDRQIGVNLYGEVFLLHDGEYALGMVSGLFENENEKEHFKIGQPNIVWIEYKKYLNTDELIEKMSSKNQEKHTIPSVKPNRNISDYLEEYLNSTQVTPDGKLYKIKKFIASFGDLKIDIYPKDHKNPTHFHVTSLQRGINARFDINTLELINIKCGKINQKDIKKIQTFFKETPSLLEKLKSESLRME